MVDGISMVSQCDSDTMVDGKYDGMHYAVCVVWMFPPARPGSELDRREGMPGTTLASQPLPARAQSESDAGPDHSSRSPPSRPSTPRDSTDQPATPCCSG